MNRREQICCHVMLYRQSAIIHKPSKSLTSAIGSYNLSTVSVMLYAVACFFLDCLILFQEASTKKNITLVIVWTSQTLEIRHNPKEQITTAYALLNVHIVVTHQVE